MLSGADYIANVRLTTKGGEVVAAPGETCERVPAQSLPGLEAHGDIKRAPRVDSGAPRAIKKGKE